MASYLQLLLLLFISTCEFKLSPYVADAPALELNRFNLTRIAETETGSGEDFKIALVSDTHNYYRELEELIKTINNNGPYRFVVVVGDITNHGLKDEFDLARRYLNKLVPPYLVVIGNHDHLANGRKIFDRMFGETNFTFDYEGVNFIFFDNNNWEAGGVVPDIDKVEAALNESTMPLKVLISHIALFDPARFSSDSVDRWQQILQAFQVNYIINGHNHNPEEGEFGGAQQITVGSLAKKVYFELIFSGGGVIHKKINF